MKHDVVTVNEIMDKFSCGRTKAIEIMKVPELHAMCTGNSIFVDRQRWNRFIEDLINGTD